MRHHVEGRPRRGALVRAGLTLALLGLSACGQYRSKLGEFCTVYATGESCASGLECSCRLEGCVCVSPCGDTPEGASSCPAGTTCTLGRNPAQNSSAYYCFPTLDGGT